MSAKQGFDFSHLQNWKDGLRNLDEEKIQSALETGISANTYVDGKHPLHFILSASDGKRSRSGKILSAMMYDPTLSDGENDNIPEKKRHIVDLLLSHNMSLLEPLKGTQQRIIDSVLLDRDSVLVSKLVVEAIKESIADDNIYTFDFNEMLEQSQADTKEDADPIEVKARKEQFTEKLRKIEEIHGYVRMAVTNPASEEDRTLFSSTQDDLSFWSDDFAAPSEEVLTHFFPIDEEALKVAEKKARNSPMSLFGFGRSTPKDEDDKIITLKKEDPEAIMEELAQYTGIEDFKNNMRSLMFRVRFDQARKANGLTTDVQNYHTAFMGNPGTGKTTCSRLKARLLHSLGMTGPKYAEMSRDSIIGKYMGQTENKIKEILEEVDTLFIDEAYALVDGQGNRQDYGYRAVDTIVSSMGNRKDSFTLFVAGYSEPMKRFIAANEGLSSRIKVFEEMRDFTTHELGHILDNNLATQCYTLGEDVRDLMCKGIETEKMNAGNSHFGNARVVVSLVQDLPNHMAYRLAQDSNGNFEQFNAATLSEVHIEDVKRAWKSRGIDIQTDEEHMASLLGDNNLNKDGRSPHP